MGSRVAVYTQNFRFYHDILRVLKMWHIPFVSVPSVDKIPPDISLVLSAETDERLNLRQIRKKRAIEAVREAVPYLLGKTAFNELVVGVDPGPKPGVAVFGDGVLLEALEAPSIDNAVSTVVDFKESYLFRQLTVNIGDGDKSNGDAISTGLLSQDIRVNFVDERNTSAPHQMHNNALSAARIAQGHIHQSNGKNEPRVRNRDALDFEFLTLRKILVS